MRQEGRRVDKVGTALIGQAFIRAHGFIIARQDGFFNVVARKVTISSQTDTAIVTLQPVLCHYFLFYKYVQLCIIAICNAIQYY